MSALVLLRHSPTGYNADRRLQGLLDVELGNEGRARAADAARAVVARYGRDLTVVSSPLARAVGSAEPIGDLAGVPVETDDAFLQRSYGVWEGLTWDEIRERWPEEYDRRMRGEDPRIEGWGRAADVASRVGEGLRRWWDPDRVTVVVSHGSSIHLGVCDLLGIDPESRTLGRLLHGSWHVVARTGDGSWQVRSLGLAAD